MRRLSLTSTRQARVPLYAPIFVLLMLACVLSRGENASLETFALLVLFD